DLVVRVVGGLGQPVRIDQLDLGLGREPALRKLLLQRLTGDRHEPQVGQLARVLLEIGQYDLEVRRYDLKDGDPALDNLVDEAFGVQDRLLPDHQGLPADQERGNQL